VFFCNYKRFRFQQHNHHKYSEDTTQGCILQKRTGSHSKNTAVTCYNIMYSSICLCSSIAYFQSRSPTTPWYIPAMKFACIFRHSQVFATVKICFTNKLYLTRKMTFKMESFCLFLSFALTHTT